MATTVRVPVGTKKNTIIALNGIPHIICEGDINACANGIGYEQIFRPNTYYDAVGDAQSGTPVETTNLCEAVTVDLHAKPICCGMRICFEIDAGIDVSTLNEGSVFFAENYLNDGSAIPLLDIVDAGATDIPVAFYSESDNCEAGYGRGESHWDRTNSITPSAGTQLVWGKVLSEDAAVVASLP